MQTGTSFQFMGQESGALKHSHLNVKELKFAAYFCFSSWIGKQLTVWSVWVKENIDIFTTGDRLRFHQDNFICIQKT
jgi:hypothetical protein